MKKNILIAVLATLLLSTLFWVWYYHPDKQQVTSGPSGSQSFANAEVAVNKVVNIALPEKIQFAGSDIPLELFYARENLERELIVNTYWHSSTLMLLKRANRWFPEIEPILAEHNIPDDFKFLCMIESNLTNARSPAGAVGFWQFLDGTAKEYGLEVNNDVDERYNLRLATKAACRYLRKSYEKFNDWALVAASYNAGQKRISNFIEDQEVNSYFDMQMAEETERYLYRILSMKLIFAEPEKYGFYPDVESLYPPLKYSVVKVDFDIRNLTDFAAGYGITYKLLKYFNPWLRSNRLIVRQGTEYDIRIPEGQYNNTHRRLRQKASQLQ